ncbi:hypothetical protein CAPTEDRAFT_19467 [Capitella teleta]|uniref:Methyltransferase type 11 domain-containing protein n=1 Tax=Capitella teleta TaxID=283909 RepID=R7V583_CAPTE|nr:hypothetical protein CAPTEDRAFT_19467 [Capitella teleta]|eukprot:ELU13622.1 hypothetical protein CAPTEDRAFT_19467 [Capitella teleta]
MVDQQCQDEKRTIAEALENEHVHKVYDQTAHYFRNARYKAWPKVGHFLNSLEPGSLVADIGCGHGKYLDINKTVFTLGCDRSAPLCSIAQQSGHSVVVSDNLRLPFRDACFDVVISIGVVHHFTTVQRRAQALKELGRVLCPGGRLMVYAWAFEQKHRTVAVGFNFSKRKMFWCRGATNIKSRNPSLLHKRYYHVFREGELGGLIETFIPEMEILESFFDHSNWCVVAQKNGV